MSDVALPPCRSSRQTEVVGADGDAVMSADAEDASGYPREGGRSHAVLGQQYGELVARARLQKVALVAAVVLVYAVWAICAVFIFVYGMQVYTLYGQAAESQFVRDWGVGLAVDNATQLNKAAQAAVEGEVLLLLMSVLSPTSWLEARLDMLSVHSTLLTGRATTWVERMMAHRNYFGRCS